MAGLTAAGQKAFVEGASGWNIVRERDIPAIGDKWRDRYALAGHRPRKLVPVLRVGSDAYYRERDVHLAFRSLAHGTKRRQAAVNELRANRTIRTVYLVEGAGLLKIGIASNMNSRLCSMQGGSPVPLTLLATFPGNRGSERLLHRQFSSIRRHGEWFEFSQDILKSFDERGAKWHSISRNDT
jgi:hypothetical protein